MEIHLFWALSAAGWLGAVISARVRRGRLYATFAGILVGIHSLIACTLAPHVAAISPYLLPVYGLFHALVYVHYIALAKPRMRPLAYRVLVSLPASFFAASTLLAMPWAIVGALTTPRALFVPYALGLLGLIEGLTTKREEVDLVIDRLPVEGLRRHPKDRAPEGARRPLRLVQITDPHLGPFMSVARLAEICARAVKLDPDLVLLTGDFLTMESQDSPEHLARALAPLAALPGKVFSCNGNHDHESPAFVAEALRRNGVRHLVDESTVVETPAGPVQIVGLDFHFKERATRIARAIAENPRVEGALRLVMLHNPGAIRDLPEGEGDLVLSGHTHGGQLGLVRLGLPYTIMRLFVDMPDHGLWARGRDRLYVHRGTCHYGFPVRLGVPAEESLLRVHLPAREA